MAFVVDCFVKTKDKNIIRDLKWLGCTVLESALKENCNVLKCTYGVVTGKVFRPNSSIKRDLYDCGENTGLFLALAGFRDDTMLFQWLTDGFHWGRCPTDELTDQIKEQWKIVYGYRELSPHKASIEDILDHFGYKNKSVMKSRETEPAINLNVENPDWKQLNRDIEKWIKKI